MLISRASIESVKERASLVDVAGELVKLRRQGSSVVGLCPFHSERSPSFHIRDNGKYFHCFGCGASGNVISFVMQIRGLSFPDAVTELAQRYGIRIELEKGNGPNGKALDGDFAAKTALREQVLKLNAAAQAWFEAQFKAHNSLASGYLLERGVGIEAIKEFRIGYAPADFAALAAAMNKREVQLELALTSGLIRRSERGDIYDTFRSRVTFPILDERNRIIGFGGRLMPSTSKERDSPNKAPKYLNSPETPLYEKSKVFYGMPHALAQLRQTKEAVIVEGYFDVIGLWQAGVRRALATCGTALTEFHVKRLMHLVNRVVLLFDGDAAGIAAAGKVFPLFVNSGLDVQVVALPAGEDPDTFALKYGEQTATALEKLPRRPLLDCFIDYLAASAGGVSGSRAHELAPAAKGKVATQLSAVLLAVKNEVERTELLERSANILKISWESLLKMTSSIQTFPQASPQTSADSSVAKWMRASQIGELDEEDLACAAAVTEVPHGIDRGLLASVMANKGTLPALILADGALCELLAPVTIEFIAGFSAILGDATLTDAQRKEAVRAMLRGYGKPWLILWKQAHEQIRQLSRPQGLQGRGTQTEDPLNFEEVLKHARMVAQRQRIQGLIKELERGIAESGDDGEKLALTKAKIELVRQAQAL